MYPDKKAPKIQALNISMWLKRFKSGLHPMHNQNDYHGPYEIVNGHCGLCRHKLQSYWCGKGLLRGPYVLLGNVLFHNDCAEEYLKPLNERMEPYI